MDYLPNALFYRLVNNSMALKNEHKIYAGLLVLAVGALFIDRVIIGSTDGPIQTASAQPIVASASLTSTHTNHASNNDIIALTNSNQWITDRLQALAQAKNIRAEEVLDGFEPSKRWTQQLNPNQHVNKTRLSADEFRKKYQLMAVITTNGTSHAVINGQTFKLGQNLDGYRLTVIKKRTISFRDENSQIDLTLSPNHDK